MKRVILIFFILMFIIFIAFFVIEIKKDRRDFLAIEKQKNILEKELAKKEEKILIVKNENLVMQKEIADFERQQKEIKKKLEKEKVEKIKRAKRNILPYKKSHRIFSSKIYLPVNISEKYKKDFSIAEVVKGDNYWTILQRVFGKNIWVKFSSAQKNKFVAYSEKVNRVGRYNIKKGMKLVLPNSSVALDFSPVKWKLSETYLAEISSKRDRKIGQYWNDFGSAYGNSIFQSRANRNSSHIMIINRKTQYFGMYKNGILQNWGPISSGKKGHRTPAGFYVSLWYKDMWHSKTYGDAEMPNAVNYDPDGFFTHAGALPGYPQSHGCPRVLKGDSLKIFNVAKSEVFPIVVL